jgi:hypothetical protein
MRFKLRALSRLAAGKSMRAIHFSGEPCGLCDIQFDNP